jgi:hypothetical protein
MRYADCVGTPQERLERKLVRTPNGCLEWTGSRSPDGYGMIGDGAGKVVRTHRLAWSLVNGPIPEGVLIRHFVCDNPPCCDETHLRSGTNADNTADKMASGHWRGNPHAGAHNTAKTHCPQKHEYDEANTRCTDVQRHCRACGRLAQAAYRLRQKAKVSA